MNRPLAGITLAFGAAAISGFSVFINAQALRAFGDPTLYTTVKNLIAAVLLMGLLAVATRSAGLGQGLTMPRTSRELWGLIAVGVIGGGFPFLLFFGGLALVTSTDAAFIHKTLVVWVAIFAVAFLRERFTLVHAGAIGVLMLGQVLSTRGLGAPTLELGAAMILAATLLWSIEVVIAKAMLRSLSPLTVGAARMGIGVVILIAFVLVTGGLAGLAAVTPAAWLWVLATGVILTAYVAVWYSALARAQAIDVSAVLVFGAVITAFVSAGFDLARISASAGGLALITVGALAIAAASLPSRRTAS